jgi:ribonuclease P protein component
MSGRWVKRCGYAGIFLPSTPLSTGVDDSVFGSGDIRYERRFSLCTPCGKRVCKPLVYTHRRALEKGARSSFSLSNYREADLPAQCAPPEAQARVPRAHGDARRSRDPQASAGERPQTAVGLDEATQRVQRRYRLSRSRDFDAVYRHGRSVSTRFLTLYWFPREDGDEPRLGVAVPKAGGGAVVRNRLKRRLREAWRARLDSVRPGCDYVLVARPGLAESVEARGTDWLGERIDEVLGKAEA